MADASHTFATSDEQEAEMLRLAMAISATDASGQPAAPTPQAPKAPAPPQQPAPASAADSAGGGMGGLLRALRSQLSIGAAAAASAAAGLPTCATCGKPAGGDGTPVLQANGKSYHAACFVCAGCHKPLVNAEGGGSFQYNVGEDGQPYHAPCHRELFAPRCSVCKDFIPQLADGRVEWNEHPFWKELRFCPAHREDGTQQCCACSRMEPRGSGWAVLKDGGGDRRLCLECLGTVVLDSKDAQPLYGEVREFFKAQGMPHPYAPPLLLVESSVLEDHASREVGRSPGEDGPIFHVRGLCVATVYTSIPTIIRSAGDALGFNTIAHAFNANGPLPAGAEQHCKVQSILVLYGLPRLLCGSIVAHELTHAWIRMQDVAQIDPRVEEGLCQLMAYLWLESQDHEANKAGPEQGRLVSYLTYQIRNDRSPIYGDGFRRALELYQLRGLRALFDHVLKNKAWPVGWDA